MNSILAGARNFTSQPEIGSVQSAAVTAIAFEPFGEGLSTRSRLVFAPAREVRNEHFCSYLSFPRLTPVEVIT